MKKWINILLFMLYIASGATKGHMYKQIKAYSKMSTETKKHLRIMI